MANPYFGPHLPYTHQQYPPWMYQRSYPFPGFRQAGACPQHGAFYGHGGCFQLPHHQPVETSHGVYGNSAFQANPAATGFGLSTQQATVSSGMNAPLNRSNTNTLSARAQSFVPISAQYTISSVGGSSSIALKNSNVGQRPFAPNDDQASHSPSVIINTTGPTDISRNVGVGQNISASVEPGLHPLGRRTSSTSVEPGEGITARQIILANIEADQNPLVPSTSSTQCSSPMRAVQQNLQPSHQISFPNFHSDQPKNVKSLLIDICRPYHLRVFCSSLYHS